MFVVQVYNDTDILSEDYFNTLQSAQNHWVKLIREDAESIPDWFYGPLPPPSVKGLYDWFSNGIHWDIAEVK